MATFSTRFLGCKVSFADAQAIRERLLADGHSEVDDGGEIQVINTCCVTHEAVSKSRKAAARAARSARTVYVTGCASNLDGAFAGTAANVVVTGRTGEDAAGFVAGDVGAIGCVNAEHRLDRIRAFVKIQDGCSFACAFCVIPLVRGATRSRTAAAVLAEIRRRVGAVFLGSQLTENLPLPPIWSVRLMYCDPITSAPVESLPVIEIGAPAT